MTLNFDSDNYISLAVMQVSLSIAVVYSVNLQQLAVRCTVITRRDVQLMTETFKRVDQVVAVGEIRAGQHASFGHPNSFTNKM